jgi:DNA-binding IclR family transcriptional regulator
MQCGMQCLQLLASSQESIGSREMARKLGLEHTRAHRALGTLEQMGFAVRTADGKYRPGPAIHVLAAQSLRGSRLLGASLAQLRELHSRGLTVALGVLWTDQVCYLIHARPHQKLDESIGSHELWPANNSSLGAVLLAAEAGWTATARQRLAPQIAAPLSSPGNYIKQVRSCMSARLRYSDGTVSLAVPVGEPTVAAIGISSPDLSARDAQKTLRELGTLAAKIASELR